MSNSTPPTTPSDEVSLSITSPADVESQLGAAVDTLLSTAADRNCGILVRRQERGKYTVLVTQDVPFRLTREQPTWNRTRRATNGSRQILPEPLGSAGKSPGTREVAIA